MGYPLPNGRGFFILSSPDKRELLHPTNKKLELLANSTTIEALYKRKDEH